MRVSRASAMRNALAALCAIHVSSTSLVASAASPGAGYSCEVARSDPEVGPAGEIGQAIRARSRGDWEGALQRLEVYAAKQRAEGGGELLAASLLELGNTQVLLENPSAARDSYAESESLFRRAGDAENAIRAALNDLELLLEARRRPVRQSDPPESDAGAEPSARLDAITQELDAMPTPPSELELRAAQIGLLYASVASEGESAAHSRQRAAKLLTDLAGRAAEAGDRRLESRALGSLGQVYESAGRQAEALTLTRRARHVARAIDAPDLGYRWEWQAGRIERAREREAPALSHFRRSVALLGELREESVGLATRSGASFRQRVEPVYLGLVELLLDQAGQAAADPDEHQALLSEARDVVEEWKRAELRNFFRDPCLAAQLETAPERVPGTTVVYPISLENRLELIVGRGDLLTRTAVPVSAAELEAALRDFGRALRRPASRAYRRPGSRLYAWLIAPIEPQLEKHPHDTLVFVLGGALRTVPMAALYDPHRRKHLVERYAIAVTPSLRSTQPGRSEASDTRVLFAGLRTAVQGYPALRFVEGELDAIRDHFPTEVLLDEDFSARRLESELGANLFRILHIASHGEIKAAYGESYLLSFEDRITFEKLAGMLGRTRFRDEPVELLTLSACSTAVGDERAALGLAGVAIRSGARSALASLWHVQDEATARLMAAFYEELARPGATRAGALRAAQVRLIGEVAHPYYWSPFVLFGAWL